MPAGRGQIVGVTAVPGLGGQLLPAQLPHVVSEGESQVECSGPQPTGCLFRSAVSALVTRHAHVGGDPLQDDVGATSNELVHTTTISLTTSSLEDLLLILTSAPGTGC